MKKEEEIKEELYRALEEQKGNVRGNNPIGYAINQQRINTLSNVLNLNENLRYIK